MDPKTTPNQDCQNANFQQEVCIQLTNQGIIEPPHEADLSGFMEQGYTSEEAAAVITDYHHNYPY